jgi:hypothetical protein
MDVGYQEMRLSHECAAAWVCDYLSTDKQMGRQRSQQLASG